MTDETASRPENTIAVVGAGISGLLLANALQARGESVIVLEKSRGMGGRLATKRVGNAVFDQGAQFFTAKDARFLELVVHWQARGVVTNWPAALAPRLIGVPNMNALGKLLAAGLDVRRDCTVLSARRSGAEWSLAIQHQPALRAGRLVLTAPAPQSLALLEAGGERLPAALVTGLRALTYHPCLALLVTLSGPSAVPQEGLALDDGPVRWISDNTKKGVSPGTAAAVTVHLSRAFSAEHFATTETDLASLVLPTIAGWLGAPVTHVALHRWKFSEPVTTYDTPCVWRPELGLGLAGDAFGGPRVEGAAISGLALADCMTESSRA